MQILTIFLVWYFCPFLEMYDCDFFGKIHDDTATALVILLIVICESLEMFRLLPVFTFQCSIDAANFCLSKIQL